MTATITVLAEKGAPLSHTEMDNNFRALRNLVEVPTVAALRALGAGAIPNDAGTVITHGCLAASDGGGGVWRWDASSSAADNTGTVVLPTGHVGNGRWVRVTDGTINALWFPLTSVGVQAALDATGTGQTLLIPAATYAIAAGGIALSSKSNITIIADPGAQFVFQADITQNPANLSLGPTAAFVIENCSNITVRGIQFVPNSKLGACIAIVSSSHITINDIHADGVKAHAAIVAGNTCSYITISECVLTNGAAWPGNNTRGVWISDVNYPEDTYIDILNNVITGNTTTGIAINAGYGRISGNTLISNNGSGIAVSGGSGRAAHDLVISENLIKNSGYQSIQMDVVYTTDADIVKNIIINNNILYDDIGTTNTHIYVIYANNVVVTNNKTYGQKYGIAVYRYSDVINISNNIINSPITTALLVSATSGNIADVVIDGNVIDATGNTDHGIYVAQVSGSVTINRVLISNNLIKSVTRWGIGVTRGTANTVTNVVLTGNVATDSLEYDCRVSSVEDIDIHSNTFTTSLGLDIELTGATPSFTKRKYYTLHNSTPVTVTNFVPTNVDVNGIYYITTRSTNITLQHNANIQLKGGVDVNIPNGGIMAFMRTTVWVELYRSF